MKGERWVEEVMKMAGYLPEYPGDEAVHFAAKLLARQHAAVVRMVKKLTRYDVNKDYHENQQYLGLFKDGRFIKLDDALSAMAKQDKSKKD